MKKKALSIVLAIVMVFSVTTTPAYAIDFESSSEPVTKVLAKVVGTVFENLVGVVNLFLRENDKFIDEEEYVYDEAEDSFDIDE